MLDARDQEPRAVLRGVDAADVELIAEDPATGLVESSTKTPVARPASTDRSRSVARLGPFSRKTAPPSRPVHRSTVAVSAAPSPMICTSQLAGTINVPSIL